jgi:hypothetical protein
VIGMDLEQFLKRYIHDSEEARIDNLFGSIKVYLNEIKDVRSRVASIHLLIRKLRSLSAEYQKFMKNE